jgi:hypothetical protein
MIGRVPLSGRSCGLALGLGIALVGYYMSYVQPQVTQLRHLAPQVTVLREQVTAVQETLVRFDEIARGIGQLEGRWQQVADQLVSRAELPAWVERLREVAADAGWLVREVRVAPPPARGSGSRGEEQIQTVTVLLEGSGDVQAASALLEWIEQGGRAAAVTELTFRAVAGEPGHLSGRMALTIYVTQPAA